MNDTEDESGDKTVITSEWNHILLYSVVRGFWCTNKNLSERMHNATDIEDAVETVQAAWKAYKQNLGSKPIENNDY